MGAIKHLDKYFEACEQIAKGRSLPSVMDGMGLHMGNFFDAAKQDESLYEAYERACELRAYRMFEEIQQIADCEDDDLFTDEKGKQRINHDVIARDALRTNTRKWMLSKMVPKKYGEKLDIDAKHSGEIKIQISREDEDLGV